MQLLAEGTFSARLDLLVIILKSLHGGCCLLRACTVSLGGYKLLPVKAI